MTNPKILGIDIGGTKCTVVLGIGSLKPGEEMIEVIDRVSFSTTQEKYPENVIKRIILEINSFLRKHKQDHRAGMHWHFC